MTMDVFYQPRMEAYSTPGAWFHVFAMNMRLFAAAFLSALLLVGECIAEPSLTFTGRFEHRTDPESLEMLGGLICFYPSYETAQSLPRPHADTRLAWFCFTNKEVVERLMGIAEIEEKGDCGYVGHATVEIVSYIPYLGGGDGFDTAQIQSVRDLSSIKALACE